MKRSQLPTKETQTDWLTSEGQRREGILSNEWKQNKLEFILRSDKVNFKPKVFRKYKENHYLLIKRLIHQEDKAMPGSAGTLL